MTKKHYDMGAGLKKFATGGLVNLPPTNDSLLGLKKAVTNYAANANGVPPVLLSPAKPLAIADKPATPPVTITVNVDDMFSDPLTKEALDGLVEKVAQQMGKDMGKNLAKSMEQLGANVQLLGDELEALTAEDFTGMTPDEQDAFFKRESALWD